MIDLSFQPLQPLSFVTTVAGNAQHRFVLELHTPDDDIRLEFGNLQSLTCLRRAVLALYRDASHLSDCDHLQTRVFHYAPGPQPLPIWHTTSLIPR